MDKGGIFWRHALMASLLGVLAAWPVGGRACEFIVLVDQSSAGLAQRTAEIAPTLDFLAAQSSPPNNDGYGIVAYGHSFTLEDGQRFHATGQRTVWRGHNDSGVMDSAFAAIADPHYQARLVLGHVRNGSGGWGSHPFTVERLGRTYSFQHNGDLTDGTSLALKEALLHGLEQSGSLQPPDFAGSNWLGQPGDVASWIDSELLFLYLMWHIDAAGGDLLEGLRAALREEDWYGFNVQADIRGADSLANPASVINFALSDGESVVVYKNARDGDPNHQLAWRMQGEGLVAVKTEHDLDFTALRQHEALLIPSQGAPQLVADVYAEDPAVLPTRLGLLSASPNPFNPRCVLHFQLPEAGEVSVAIYNLQGQRVAHLLGTALPAGLHAVPWDGQWEGGGPAASGTYVAVLRQGGSQVARKLLLVR